MGFFRFKRSIKLLPGVRWNFGKKSTSLSIGPRGAHYTFGTAGSRTTVGIPGTGLSYTDIHSSHTRVAAHHPAVPEPSEAWVHSHMVDQTLHIPDREKDEPPIRQDQIGQLTNLKNVDLHGYDIHSLGSEQAYSLIQQIQVQQKEVSKTLLKRFYASHGHAIPDDFIDHCYDHPDQPWVQPNKKGHGCLILLGILLFIGWLGNLTQKQQPASASSSTTPVASSQVAAAHDSKLPVTSASPSSNSQLPAPNFWPKQVRISAPVVLSGTVDGGTISETAKPGDILDATLSADHQSITLRRLDISGTIPIGETDFVERALKAEAVQ